MRAYKKYRILSIIPSTIVAFVMLAVLSCSSGRGNSENAGGAGRSVRGLSAVPTDAAALFLFEKFDSALDFTGKEKETIAGGVIFGNLKLQPLIEVLGRTHKNMGRRGGENLNTLLSVHYSAQNELSLLLVMSLSNAVGSQFASELSSSGAIIHARSFNGVSISRFSGVEYFISDTLLIASASPLTIESSIRHLNSRTSMIDNEEFVKLYNKRIKVEDRLLINHAQIGKIFSGLAERSYLKYSDFVSKFASWSDFEITSSRDRVSLAGALTNNRGMGNYSQIFTGARSLGSEVMSILPSNTYSLFTLSVKNLGTLSENYGDYMRFHRRYNEDSWKRATAWFGEINGKNVSLAAIPYGGRFEYVTIIRKPEKNFVSRIFGKKKSEPVVGMFTQKGYVKTLFGELFSVNPEESFMESDEWFIIGGENIIEEFRKGSFDRFTMEEYVSQTEMKKILSEERSLLSIVINGSEYPDSLISGLRREHRAGIEEINRDKNLRMLYFGLFDNIDKGITVESLYYADSIANMPTPVKRDPEGGVLGWELDTIVRIPTGPFELVNYTTGEKEYLTQLNNNWLRFSDKDNKGLWSAPFSEPIKGFVEQIDFYDNGKLQMLFATTNQLHLLDRTGRFVSPFPKKMEYDIVLGPKVYNLRRENSPAVMLLHTDNVFRLYDKHGRSHSLQVEITTEEILKEFPELIDIEGNSYWVLRTPVKCMIYSIDGTAVSETSGGSRLRSDTEIIMLGEGKIKVTAISGTEYRLDLATGKMDKRVRN